jgi:hypothetical protein
LINKVDYIENKVYCEKVALMKLLLILLFSGSFLIGAGQKNSEDNKEIKFQVYAYNARGQATIRDGFAAANYKSAQCTKAFKLLVGFTAERKYKEPRVIFCECSKLRDRLHRKYNIDAKMSVIYSDGDFLILNSNQLVAIFDTTKLVSVLDLKNI